MTQPQEPWTRVMSTCVDATRVLVLEHVQDDTYIIREGEEVSLSDRATLTLLLKQLSGREDP